jgi:threonyl-tRNA synthetase
VTVYKCG